MRMKKISFNIYASFKERAMSILVPFHVFLVFNVLTIGVTYGQQIPYSYAVEENIALDCGASGKQTSNSQRSWDGDVSSKFFLSSEDENGASVTFPTREPLTSSDPVPYRSARLSRSAFGYRIPVIPGPKFVRLHFFASEYENYDRSKAFFSVKAGKFTLLSNFSTSLAADYSSRNDIVREFCITVGVEDAGLNITFIPASSIPEAYAFVSGIEVVSIPVDLFSSATYLESGIRFLGQSMLFQWNNGTAVETVHRVNIGGSTVSSNEDTGFFRSWDDMNTEAAFLEIVKPSALLEMTNSSIKLHFTAEFPQYIAPESVYRTARNLGPDQAANKKYNLTWNFPVDSGFNYRVRLHFCEITEAVNRTSDRVFNIYIEHLIAENTADLIQFCGGKYTTCFRDYIVRVGTPGVSKGNLSVTLQAKQHESETKFFDAILNGVEIFKLSDSNHNLAGLNPDPIPAPPSRQLPTVTNGKNRNTVIGIAAGVVSGVVVLALVAFFLVRRGRKDKDLASDGTTWWGPYSYATTTKSSKTQSSTNLPSDLCRYFTLAEIKSATNGFDDLLVIGVGGFGNVYKGYIDNGVTPVAVKRLKTESSQGAHEFKTEIEMLSHLRHRHLVSLIGFCDDHGEMILVYEYMSRGTFRDHLYKTENPPLPWKTRLEICIGAARGLHYLHTGAKNTIIHRDVKTTNILLDEKWEAKVSDFGLSKAGSSSVSKAHVTTVVKGSFGYLDPEYYNLQHLTEKSDVYSFGVVLCEVLCARPPVLRDAERRQISLAKWAKSSQASGTLNRIVDTHLAGQIAPECLKKYGEIAVSCMLDVGTERPSMSDVVWALEFALQLQQNAEDKDKVCGPVLGSGGEVNEDEDVTLVNNDSDATFTCSWNDTPGSTGVTKNSSSEQESTMNESVKVFSELYDPKGR